MANTLSIILWIILSFVCFIIYHKMFDVVYFSGQAFTRELVGCLLAGGLLLYLIFRFWWVAIIIGVLFFASLGKSGSK